MEREIRQLLADFEKIRDFKDLKTLPTLAGEPKALVNFEEITYHPFLSPLLEPTGEKLSNDNSATRLLDGRFHKLGRKRILSEGRR